MLACCPPAKPMDSVGEVTASAAKADEVRAIVTTADDRENMTYSFGGLKRMCV